MKNNLIVYFGLFIFTTVSCIDEGIKPLKDCVWSNTKVIKLTKVSLEYPDKTDDIDIEDEIETFNKKARVGEWEFDEDWDDDFWEHHYIKNKILRLTDIFKYGEAWENRVSKSQIDVTVKATGNCSPSTESASSTYKLKDNNVFDYEPRYSNFLNNQYFVNSFSDPNTNNDNSVTITVTFGPIENKVNNKMGIITWSKTIESNIYYPSDKEISFESTGTFKTIEEDVKSIYIGDKFVIKSF